MLKTLPRRANQVSVHPPMSQIRIGAVAWIVAIGSRLPVAPAGNGYLVSFSLAASSRLRNPTWALLPRGAYLCLVLSPPRSRDRPPPFTCSDLVAVGIPEREKTKAWEL